MINSLPLLFSFPLTFGQVQTSRIESKDVGICSVFGDPHYRTFDGKTYSFQGACRYILSTDCPLGSYKCSPGEFAIIVQNDARSSQYSWTQNVSFVLYQITGETIINMLQNLAIEVNNLPQKLPYTGNSVKIFKEKHKIRLFSHVGITIVWDGRSMLEITAEPKHRNQLSGLCGNFNGQTDDDFINGSTGVRVPDAITFANSYKLGGERFCSVRPAKNRTPENCENLPIVKQFQAHKECEIFKSEQFKRCHSAIDPKFYHRSCLNDSCGDSCEEGQNCGCSALKSYTQECAEKGIKIHWQEHKHCTVQCTNGQVYSECGTRSCQNCNRFWKDKNGLQSCTSKKCRPGCYCRKSFVLYRGKCIVPDKCPRKYREQGKKFDIFNVPKERNPLLTGRLPQITRKYSRGKNTRWERGRKLRTKNHKLHKSKSRRIKHRRTRYKGLDFFLKWKPRSKTRSRRKPKSSKSQVTRFVA